MFRFKTHHLCLLFGLRPGLRFRKLLHQGERRLRQWRHKFHRERLYAACGGSLQTVGRIHKDRFHGHCKFDRCRVPFQRWQSVDGYRFQYNPSFFGPGGTERIYPAVPGGNFRLPDWRWHRPR